jgi:hypothetical protein
LLEVPAFVVSGEIWEEGSKSRRKERSKGL